jgi:hypothetical protein
VVSAERADLADTETARRGYLFSAFRRLLKQAGFSIDSDAPQRRPGRAAGGIEISLPVFARCKTTASW